VPLNVDSTTGLMLNSKGGLGAVEVGDLGVGVRSDIYLSAVWIEALDRVSRMAAVMEPAKKGRKGPALADEARRLREQALGSLRERFWLPEQQMYAFALDRFRSEGMRWANVDTGLDDGHAPARRAYERAGFDISISSIRYYKELAR
jgi:hypothetical protein